MGRALNASRALLLAVLLGCAGAAMARTPAVAGGSAFKDQLTNYRRCMGVRAILTPHLLADRQARAVGAALDCLHHHGDTLATVMSPPRPVPRLLRSRRAAKIVAQASTWMRRWAHGADGR